MAEEKSSQAHVRFQEFQTKSDVKLGMPNEGLLKRERSFHKRPLTRANPVPDNYYYAPPRFNGAEEYGDGIGKMQRARSFVQPGQLQKQASLDTYNTRANNDYVSPFLKQDRRIYRPPTGVRYSMYDTNDLQKASKNMNNNAEINNRNCENSFKNSGSANRNCDNFNKNHENMNRNYENMNKIVPSLMRISGNMNRNGENHVRNNENMNKNGENHFRNNEKMNTNGENHFRNNENMNKYGGNNENMNKNSENHVRNNKNMNKNGENHVLNHENMNKNGENHIKNNENANKNGENISKGYRTKHWQDMNSENMNIKCDNDGQKFNLNIHAKEFVYANAVNRQNCEDFKGRKIGKLQHSKSELRIIEKSKISSGGRQNSTAYCNGNYVNENHSTKNEKKNSNKFKVSFDTSVLKGDSSSSARNHNSLARSKSLGTSCDLGSRNNCLILFNGNLDPFPADRRKVIQEALKYPCELSTRKLMAVASHMFEHVTESSKNSENTAKICLKVIENDSSATFLETLLNTCQEFYLERNNKFSANSSQNSRAGSPQPNIRWMAYMSFLNEMYTQLKRHQNKWMTTRLKSDNGLPPGLFLLTLLAQCCLACLQKSNVNSMAQTECLFFVLTSVGKDIETKLPHHMESIMTAARDAFLTMVRISAVRKTLLQLIEMRSAKWQLPASAVMYYYPGSAFAK